MNDEPSLLSDILKKHLRATVRMLTNGIKQCPDLLWDQAGPAGAPPPWKQIYHALYWFHEWFHDWTGALELPPCHSAEAMYLKEGGRVVTRAEMLEFAAHVTRVAEEVLSGVRDGDLLAEHTRWRKAWTMADRMLAEVRHVQHHVGYLNATLRAGGAPAVEWIGYRE